MVFRKVSGSAGARGETVREAGQGPRRAAPRRAPRLLAAAALLAAWPAVQADNEVQPGDTFSAIAARYTGSVRTWRKLYDERLSRLPDPNRIVPGMRFEMVSEASGRRYLRLVPGTEHGEDVAAAPAKPTAPPKAAATTAATIAAPTAETAPAASAPAAAERPALSAGDPLVVAVLPNIAATTLMAQYENLKAYLERVNPQKASIVLPPNFKVFYEGMMSGTYDVAIAAPHFARVAQVDGRMVPLALYEPRIGAQFVAPADSAISGPADLRGKGVAFANPQSLVAMYGRQWLREQNLDEGKDYEIKGARTDMGVGRMMLTGEVAAAIMSNGEFRSLPPEESARMKVVQVFARIPNFVVLGNPKLGSERLARLKAQFLAFPADGDNGAAFTKATGITGIVDADEAQLRELDPFVAPTRRAMSAN